MREFCYKRLTVCNCQGWEERASLCVCLVCMIRPPSIDGELSGADKQQTMMNSFGVPIACHDSFHSTPPTDQRTDWLVEGERDWPVTQGHGHLPGRRSCWTLCWMFRCFACAVRWWPGSPMSGKRCGGRKRRDGEVTEQSEGGETTTRRDTSAFNCIYSS